MCIRDSVYIVIDGDKTDAVGRKYPTHITARLYAVSYTHLDGRVRNGSLVYTIRPIQEALELNYQRQFLQVERNMERAKAEKRLAELNRQNKKEESA